MNIKYLGCINIFQPSSKKSSLHIHLKHNTDEASCPEMFIKKSIHSYKRKKKSVQNQTPHTQWHPHCVCGLEMTPSGYRSLKRATTSGSKRWMPSSWFPRVILDRAWERQHLVLKTGLRFTLIFLLFLEHSWPLSGKHLPETMTRHNAETRVWLGDTARGYIIALRPLEQLL